MPTAEFFDRFGILTIPRFLDPDACAELQRQMQAAPASVGTVYGGGGVDVIDEEVRSVKLALVPPIHAARVRQQLLETMPRVEAHFGVELAGFQPLQFLVYQHGAHYLPHRDNDDAPDSPTAFHRRAVAAVLFLNGEATDDTSDGYRGGALAFYGLLDDPAGVGVGFPLVGEPGLLVCFRATTLHEVRPVIAGERYTVVTWFNWASES